MDRQFTFRFYNISRDKPSIPSMLDMLRTIDLEPDKAKRERRLATDYVVRLENLEDDGKNAVVGELVRCQDTNLPAELSGGKRRALTAQRLGHSVVFRLNHEIGALGIQYDRRIVSPGRLLDYIADFNPKAVYTMTPKINEEAWSKFTAGGTRKLAIRIANPDQMTQLSGHGAAAARSFRSMAEAYQAPSILIEISMGHHKGFLSGAVEKLARQLSGIGGGARLDRLSAVTVIDDKVEEIDLIEDRMIARDELEIDARDPETNWRIKRDYLCREMKKLIG